jgi:two-component system phosphate regulon sensor histidine kinase PhoR
MGQVRPGAATEREGTTPSSGDDERPCPACDEFADRTGAALGLRVTIIAKDGRVLGDSTLDGQALEREENHARRPEILAARMSGSGSSTRHSTTVDDDLFYVARRIDRAGAPAGYVRVAIPLREVERIAGRPGETLALLSFLILVLVAIAGYAAARRFSRPIEETAAAADAIASGQRDVEIEYEGSDELGSLGSALNRMTRAVNAQIEELSDEKKLRDSILEGMNEGILVVDRERRVLLANDALRSALRLRDRDPSGRALIEICRDLEVVGRSTRPSITGSRRPNSEDWTAIVLELSVAPLTRRRRGRGRSGSFDVTRPRRWRRCAEFVADVSHELRTPLTSIKAFIETLLAGGLEDASNNRRFLEIVRKHAGRMQAILDDLTDLSSIETGASSLEWTRVELAGAVADIVDSLRPKAEARGVSIILDIPPGLVLAADRRRLEQILVNLLDNAVKFNREGGRVTVRARSLGAGASAATASASARATSSPSSSLWESSASEAVPPFASSGRQSGGGVEQSPSRPGGSAGSASTGASGVEIEVEDTGVGIPAESLGRIFLRFYRVDKARSREMGGTGLGLAIVKHLMRLHGGSVRVESREGEGSRFILEFPAETSRASAAS